jgi:hypothetical protein
LADPAKMILAALEMSLDIGDRADLPALRRFTDAMAGLTVHPHVLRRHRPLLL